MDVGTAGPWPCSNEPDATPRRPVRVLEYQSVDLQLSDDDIAILAGIGADRVGATPLGAGSYRIMTTAWVGTVGLPSGPLLILPKVPATNLVRMLCRGEQVNIRTDPFDYPHDEEFVGLLSDLFCRASQRALSRGVLHGYREDAHELPYVRGRIDLADASRHPWRVVPLQCQFEEYTADIAENRVLLGSVRRLQAVLGDQKRQSRLQWLMARLADGTWLQRPDRTLDVRPRLLTGADARAIRRTRLNRHYHEALSLAALVLDHIALIHGTGDVTASAFLVDMNEVFERYVADLLAGTLNGLTLSLRTQVRRKLDVEGRLIAFPDIVIYLEGRPVAVLDTKYKRLKTGERPGANDVYQMIAYCENLAAPTGILIYPESGRAEYPLTRPSGVRILTMPFPIEGSSGEFDAGQRRFVAELTRILALTAEGRDLRK